MSWLRTLFRRRPDADFSELETTKRAMRDVRRIAEDLSAGRYVPNRRFVEAEMRLTGNIVEDHISGAATRNHHGGRR